MNREKSFLEKLSTYDSLTIDHKPTGTVLFSGMDWIGCSTVVFSSYKDYRAYHGHIVAYAHLIQPGMMDHINIQWNRTMPAGRRYGVVVGYNEEELGECIMFTGVTENIDYNSLEHLLRTGKLLK